MKIVKILRSATSYREILPHLKSLSQVNLTTKLRQSYDKS